MDALNKSSEKNPYPQYSLVSVLVFSILPGGLVTLGFIILKPLIDSSSYPPLMAFLLAVLLLNIPVMLGVMLYEGNKLNGRLSLEGVVLYHEKVSWGTFALVFIGAFVVLYLLISLLAPISAILSENIFAWLPAWMNMEERTQYGAFTKSALVATFVFQLIITGLVLPWIEEYYFRGYLLPRISRFGVWAPLLGGLFFGLYHLWSPYTFLTVFLLGAALGYVVWWKRDIRLSISLHVFANVTVRVMFLLAALAI